jgi:hypothetical protein
MDKEKILKLSEKNKYSPETSIEEIKKSLEKKYNISYGKYSHGELKKAIVDSSPFFIQNNLIIGFDPTDDKFISDKKEKISIERLVKAVIIEDEKDFEDRPPLRLSDDENSTAPVPNDNRDPFIIMGKQDWPKDSLGDQINRFNMVFGNLKVGELFLPPHSVIVNFLESTDDQKKKKIVSMILGNNISLYDDREYIDNTMHEIGHIFWRDCVKFDERKKFYEHFKLLRPGAIYEFEWEKSSEEEVFCTVYKWYLKSLLISKSFYNILAFEDEKGLNLLEAIFDRKRKEAIIKDMWDLRKEQLFEYLQPKFDITSNSFILKKGLFDEIKDIEVPEEVQAEAMNRYEDGHKWITLGKAMVPVVNGRIDWDEMKKAKANHKYKNKKPDGKGGWIYDYGRDTLSLGNTIHGMHISLKEGETVEDKVKELKEKHGGEKNENEANMEKLKKREKEYRDKALEIEERLREKYGKDEKGYRTELWPEKDTNEMDNLYNRAYELEKELYKKLKGEEKKKEKPYKDQFKKQIKNILKSNEYNIYGLRINSKNPKTGKHVKVKIGDIAESSYYQPDGKITDTEHGTSALWLADSNSIDEIMDEIEKYKSLGDEILLLGTNNNTNEGNDPGEIEMTNAKILAICKFPKIKN